MLTRLYPISLDTYSTSSLYSKQRCIASYLILLVHSADARVYCCNVLRRLDIASHSHADSPALLFSAHTIDIALLCSDIPTSELFLLPSLSFHTLPKHTLPALLCTSLMNSFLWESNFLSASPPLKKGYLDFRTLLPKRLLQTQLFRLLISSLGENRRGTVHRNSTPPTSCLPAEQVHSPISFFAIQRKYQLTSRSYTLHWSCFDCCFTNQA